MDRSRVGLGVILVAVLAALLAAVPAAQAKGRWVAGDVNTHTYLSDGKNTQAEEARQAFAVFGLNYLANADLGGQSKTGPTGLTFVSPIWRWLSIPLFSYPAVEEARAEHPGKKLIQGLDWNAPTYGPVSIGVVGVGEAAAVSNFEYLFDAKDTDASRAGEGTKEVLDTTQPSPYPTLVPAAPFNKQSVTSADAVAGAQWLEDNYALSSYAVIDTPSQKLLWNVGAVRALNDAAPDVAIGFDGIPGHQQAQTRGAYGNWFNAAGKSVPAGDPTIDQSVTNTARTYGGADWWLAKVGGVWDSLLGEGRHFWVFSNSDYAFNNTAYKDAAGNTLGLAWNDFLPGEYNKTWTYQTTPGYQGLVSGMVSGDSWVTTGDLINKLDFRATIGKRSATMGGTLNARKGKKVIVTIRFKSPAMNNGGNKVKVNHIDVIAGGVGAMIAPADPAYGTKADNATAHVVKTLKKFRVVKGWKVATLAVVPNSSIYLRLRGTNLAAGALNETDAQGNPVVDTASYQDQPNPNPSASPATVHINTPDIAWGDLWFYSNPIFISVK